MGSHMREDIAEIKAAMKAQAVSLLSLQNIASRGGGAFHAILMLGGLLGWLVGFGATVWAAVHMR